MFMCSPTFAHSPFAKLHRQAILQREYLYQKSMEDCSGITISWRRGGNYKILLKAIVSVPDCDVTLQVMTVVIS